MEDLRPLVDVCYQFLPEFLGAKLEYSTTPKNNILTADIQGEFTPNGILTGGLINQYLHIKIARLLKYVSDKNTHLFLYTFQNGEKIPNSKMFFSKKSKIDILNFLKNYREPLVVYGTLGSYFKIYYDKIDIDFDAEVDNLYVNLSVNANKVIWGSKSDGYEAEFTTQELNDLMKKHESVISFLIFKSDSILGYLTKFIQTEERQNDNPFKIQDDFDRNVIYPNLSQEFFDVEDFRFDISLGIGNSNTDWYLTPEIDLTIFIKFIREIIEKNYSTE